MNIWRNLLLLIVAGLLSACSSLFFAPQKQHALTPDQIDLAWRDLDLQAADGVKLDAWFLPAQGQVRGRVLYLHGNGENISTHIASVYWMPAQGYEVLLLDYRGYGKSDGEAELPAVLQDIDAGWQALQREGTAAAPMLLYGQSIGAALAYSWVSLRQPPALAGVIYDSGFASYPAMVRKVLAEAWLTWPFSVPVSWGFSRAHDPQRFAAQQPPGVPRLFLHSRDDKVVPIAQGRALFEANPDHACWLSGQGPHIGMVQQQTGRALLEAFLASPTSLLSSCSHWQQQLDAVDPVWVPLPTVHARRH